MKYPVCSSCIRKAMIEPLVRIGLLFVGLALSVTGWLIDWRGYMQGVGGGMCVVLTFWSGFATYRSLKPNAGTQVSARSDDNVDVIVRQDGGETC